MTSAGAVEVVVHGWGVGRACGQDRPIPSGLAEDLLPLVPLSVGNADRPARFGPVVTASPLAPAGDQLVAFLGRDPVRTVLYTFRSATRYRSAIKLYSSRDDDLESASDVCFA